MGIETYTRELFGLAPAHFAQTLQMLGEKTLFSLSPTGGPALVHLETLLFSRYEKWRTDNGVTLEFASDIQYLLTNENIRQRLATTLFQHGPPEVSQLNATLELLILAAYSRHITVNRTFKPHSIPLQAEP